MVTSYIACSINVLMSPFPLLDPSTFEDCISKGWQQIIFFNFVSWAYSHFWAISSDLTAAISSALVVSVVSPCCWIGGKSSICGIVEFESTGADEKVTIAVSA